MNKEEYYKYKSMSAKNRFIFLNNGTITENLHKLIDISNFEEEDKENVRNRKDV